MITPIIHDPGLLTPDQLCQLLQISKATLYRWTMQTGPDAIPRLKMGRHLRFIYADVINWASTR